MRTTGSASSFNRSGSVATPATTKFGALAQCRSVQIEAIIIGLAAVALRFVSHPRIAAHLHNAVHVAARSHVTHAHMPALLLLFTLPLLGLIAGAVSIRQQIGDPSFRSRLGRTFAEGFTIESFDVRAMRRRPGSRHVFSFEIVAANPLTGKQSSIGLVCKRDTTSAAGKAIREFEAMRLLWDSRFRPGRTVQDSGAGAALPRSQPDSAGKSARLETPHLSGKSQRSLAQTHAHGRVFGWRSCTVSQWHRLRCAPMRTRLLRFKFMSRRSERTSRGWRTNFLSAPLSSSKLSPGFKTCRPRWCTAISIQITSL